MRIAPNSYTESQCPLDLKDKSTSLKRMKICGREQELERNKKVSILFKKAINN